MNRSRLHTTASAVFAAGLLGVLLLAASARPGGTFVAHSGPVAGGQLIVHFGTDVSPEQQAAVLRAHGATFSRNLLIPGYVVASVPAGSEATVGQSLARSGVVATTEEDPIRQPAAAPNDPYYPQQWNMQMIGLDAAREQSDGSGVTVAVIDTGVAFENYQDGATEYRQAPDLAATTFVLPCNVFAASPPTTDPSHCPDPHANDDYGHGTHVTGTIAENTDNGYGTAGIAPKAKIMPIKVCGPIPNPPYYGCPDDKLAEGIEYAVQNGANIINLSIAGPEQISAAVRVALADAQNSGVVVVAAAGNGAFDSNCQCYVGHGTLDYPAAVESVISVGAVGIFENRAGYSNYGKGESLNSLDLVAPGGDPAAEGSSSVILQQTYRTCTSASDFTQFLPATSCSGTSMAAAHVTGVAALIESKFPGLTATQVRNVLDKCTQDLGDPGYDQQYGNGLVQADRALTDVDHDGIPDCIDPSVVTPHPTPFPTPNNECAAGTLTPPPPTFTPSPTPSAPATPTLSGPTITARPTATPDGLGGAGVSPSDTRTPTVTPTDTASATPTDTPTGTATETPSGAPTVSDTPTQTPTPSPTPIVTPRPPLCGDVDCNGQVNAADALGVLQWLTALTAASIVKCIGLGYVNCDGQLDVADAAMILRYSAALPINLPAGCPGFN